MNHKEALTELATLVGQLKQATEVYESSSVNNAQVRYEALCKIQERTFSKAEDLLAAAMQHKPPTVYEFQERIKEWADAFFTLESGRLGNAILLQEALDDFRFIWKYATVLPFLRCLRFWAKERGLLINYDTRRVDSLPRRVIVISPNLSNN